MSNHFKDMQFFCEYHHPLPCPFLVLQNCSNPSLFLCFINRHTKKGALQRAESFFSRAIQVCIPDFFVLAKKDPPNDLTSTRSTALSIAAPKTPKGELPIDNGTNVYLIVRLLQKYVL